MSPSASAIRYAVFDSFTTQRFRGNPAAVVVTDEPLSEQQYLDITREFNLSETAFVIPIVDPTTADSDSRSFHLRWFTPKVEVVLCGHATLAAAKCLFDDPERVPSTINVVKFLTLSGELTVRRVADAVELEFPAGEVQGVDQSFLRKTKDVISRAFKGAEVVYAGVGLGPSFQDFVLVELRDDFQLEGVHVDTDIFVSPALHKRQWDIY
jgi:predicted PhzF superfamily epimerase YddE/YHI9